MVVNPIVLLIGIIFAPLAAAMAFIITYGEYTHHYSDKKMPLKLATEAAITTFIVFGIISLVIGLVIGNMVNG
jgi:hypothetical protein